MIVIRRNGQKTELDISKIRKVCNWACEGLDASPIVLEASLKTRLRDGVTTREIQDNLIDCSLQLCSRENPDWRYVGGRLHIWSLWKDVLVNRGFQYGDYTRLVKLQVENNRYDKQILSYSDSDLDEASSWIRPELDTEYDYAGAVLLSKRYLLQDELPQEAFLTCALLLAVNENATSRLRIARLIYEAIAERKISLATPILANLRIPNGSLSSCFILAMDDNLESIFNAISDTARISKSGGGVGVNVSRIRSTGSWVMGRPNSSGGVIPWIKLLNDTAIAVNQGGRRAGAVTISLDVWHADIPEFLECQTENGDQRRKAYDIFPQVVIPDEFMKRVESDDDWTLLDPYEVREVFGIDLPVLWGDDFRKAYNHIENNLDRLTLTKRVKAKHLLKDIMRSQIETGMPYIAFKDAINRANPNKHEGYIPGTNLCTESYSVVVPDSLAHTCNLCSLNLANIDENDLEKYCKLAVRILDNTIDITITPIEESRHHNNRFRTIGVGVMGLADWLAKRRLSYQHTSNIDCLFEDIGYFCTLASAELAGERGAYPAFPDSDWSKGLLIGSKPLDWYRYNSRNYQRWTELAELIQVGGIRNSHVTAIAPNTSSSLVQGCTASILPTYSRFFYDKWAKGVVPIAPPFIKDGFWFYQENKYLNQAVVVRAVAVMQRWIDTGISMELLFNLNEGVYYPNNPQKAISAKEIFDVVMLSWASDIKAIYYIRTVQKDSYKDEIGGCSSCTN